VTRHRGHAGRTAPRLATVDRLAKALDAIDAANADDPSSIVVRGERRPKEIAHAELVTQWVQRLNPDPSEALLLAARAHHLRRWVIPRSSYPKGRAGYLRWRKALHERHATDVAEILEQVGYDGPTIERVQDLVRKRGLGRDPEVQDLEDALCLVFIETQLHDFARTVEPDKVSDVVAKTARKMSDRAVGLALELDLSADERRLLEGSLER